MYLYFYELQNACHAQIEASISVTNRNYTLASLFASKSDKERLAPQPSLVALTLHILHWVRVCSFTHTQKIRNVWLRPPSGCHVSTSVCLCHHLCHMLWQSKSFAHAPPQHEFILFYYRLYRLIHSFHKRLFFGSLALDLPLGCALFRFAWYKFK